MRVLIAYAGRTGTTGKAARLLADCFGEASLRNLLETDATPERYDAVVIGSCVRDGKIEPAVRKWLIRNEKTLSGMRKGVFLCNAFMNESQTVIRENFPEEFIEDCVVIDSFGGEVDFSKLRFSEKMALRKQLKHHPEMENMVPCLLTDTIAAFAEKIKAE